jgi:hypothetical protein
MYSARLFTHDPAVVLNTMKRKISKQVLVYLFIGSMCMAVPYLVNKIIPVSEGLADFMKGFGIAYMITGLIIESKKPQRN